MPEKKSQKISNPKLVKKRLAQGLADIKHGRVKGPFKTARPAMWALQKTKDLKIKDQIRRDYEEYKKGKTVPLDKFLTKISGQKWEKLR